MDVSVSPLIKSRKDICLHFTVATFQNVQRKQSVCVSKDHHSNFLLIITRYSHQREINPLMFVAVGPPAFTDGHVNSKKKVLFFIIASFCLDNYISFICKSCFGRLRVGSSPEHIITRTTSRILAASFLNYSAIPAQKLHCIHSHTGTHNED